MTSFEVDQVKELPINEGLTLFLYFTQEDEKHT